MTLLARRWRHVKLTSMATKRRAPIEQLREAGRMAKEMLIERGIQTKESTIDKIIADKKSPMLPGIPAYLPHAWTIKATQRIMRDLIIIWREECKGNKVKMEDITLFWKFCVKELHRQEKAFAKEEKEMSILIKATKEVPVLKDIFSPTRKKENAHAIQQFLVDSFAVGIVVEQNHSTSEYLNWFLDWTEALHTYWTKSKKKLKKV